MNSKAYSSRSVNLLSLDSILEDRDGQPAWVGFDIGKIEMQAVVNWAEDDFERPWRIANPRQIGVLIEHLKRLSQGRELIVAMEPSGTYGDALRQACGDAGIIVHRVHPKIAHD